MPKPKRLQTSALSYLPGIARNILELDDGFKFDTSKLTDVQYQRALSIGVAIMLADSEIKPETIAHN